MKMSQVFGKHLKAEELGPGFRRVVQIDKVEMRKVGKDEQKPVVTFIGL